MKHIFSFVFFLLFSFINATSYRDYAQQWMQTYIVDGNNQRVLPQSDINALYEVAHISYDRSRTTLQAQAAALPALTILQQGWINIAATRLNPSHQRPFVIDQDNRLQLMQDFWQAYDIQDACSKQYSVCIQQVVYGDLLTTAQAKQAVEQMRTQARVFMLEALADARTHLGTLYTNFFSKHGTLDEFDTLIDNLVAEVKVKVEDLTEQHPELRTLNITDFLLSYVPSLAVHTFIEADKQHVQISRDAWSAYVSLQEIGNYVWHAIETARVAYYQAIIDALSSVI